MLVLTRKLSELIKIGDTIEVKIIGVEGRRVKIGIDASRDVKLERAEARPDTGNK